MREKFVAVQCIAKSGKHGSGTRKGPGLKRSPTSWRHVTLTLVIVTFIGSFLYGLSTEEGKETQGPAVYGADVLKEQGMVQEGRGEEIGAAAKMTTTSGDPREQVVALSVGHEHREGVAKGVEDSLRFLTEVEVDVGGSPPLPSASRGEQPRKKLGREPRSHRGRRRGGKGRTKSSFPPPFSLWTYDVVHDASIEFRDPRFNDSRLKHPRVHVSQLGRGDRVPDELPVASGVEMLGAYYYNLTNFCIQGLEEGGIMLFGVEEDKCTHPGMQSTQQVSPLQCTPIHLANLQADPDQVWITTASAVIAPFSYANLWHMLQAGSFRGGAVHLYYTSARGLRFPFNYRVGTGVAPLLQGVYFKEPEEEALERLLAEQLGPEPNLEPEAEAEPRPTVCYAHGILGLPFMRMRNETFRRGADGAPEGQEQEYGGGGGDEEGRGAAGGGGILEGRGGGTGYEEEEGVWEVQQEVEEDSEEGEEEAEVVGFTEAELRCCAASRTSARRARENTTAPAAAAAGGDSAVTGSADVALELRSCCLGRPGNRRYMAGMIKLRSFWRYQYSILRSSGSIDAARWCPAPIPGESGVRSGTGAGVKIGAMARSKVGNGDGDGDGDGEEGEDGDGEGYGDGAGAGAGGGAGAKTRVRAKDKARVGAKMGAGGRFRAEAAFGAGGLNEDGIYDEEEADAPHMAKGPGRALLGRGLRRREPQQQQDEEQRQQRERERAREREREREREQEEEQRKRRPLLLLVIRQLRRRIVNVREVIGACERAGFLVRTVYWERMRLHEQVRLARQTDVLLGAYGMGLTHVFWMRKGSVLIELYPRGGKKQIDKHAGDYATLAYAAEVHHLVWIDRVKHYNRTQSWLWRNVTADIPALTTLVQKARILINSKECV
eukprot:jgi/Mesen1/9905/ME000070S09190